MCNPIKAALNVGTFGAYGLAENAIKKRGLLSGEGFGLGGGGDDEESMSLFQTDYLKQRRGEYDDWAGQYTDPARYKSLTDEYSQNAYTRAANQYANAGLAGSSAAIGGATEAGRRVTMDMLNRQLSDRSQIESTRLGYTSQLQNAGTAQMNAEIAKSNSDNQLLGGILSAGGAIAGGIIGGPAGAGIGGQVGGKMGGGQSAYLPQTSFDNYGQQGDYWGSNPYSNSDSY